MDKFNLNIYQPRGFKSIIIDTYYLGFLRSFYNQNPDLKQETYQKQLNKLIGQGFGTSDFYSYNLNQNNCPAIDVIVNNEYLQRQWAKENCVKVSDSRLLSKLQMFPYIYRFIGRPKWIQEIALFQIKSAKADVVYMQDLSILNPDTLDLVKKYCKLLVGQIACPLPPEENLKKFDLILTSFPHYVEKFKKLGIKSEYLPLAFEPRIINKIKEKNKIFDVTFIGSFTPHHNAGTRILEEVAFKIPIHVWGQGLHYLSPSSPLRKHFHGEAWGFKMYETLSQTKITVNRHISVSENYANNMRLYESTGVGSMLITDDKLNLNELFRINKEIISYKNVSELKNKILYYLKHDKERQKITYAGQRRTLKDHSYPVMIKQLIKIIEKHLK